MKGNFLIPLAIIIAGGLVAGAVIYSNEREGGTAAINDAGENQPDTSAVLENIKPVSEGDHIRGDMNEAGAVVVNFSDLECPFCKQFHQTMKQVFGEYDGQVVWAYRHFPLDSIHPKARKEAEATECAFELGGIEKFWEYTDRIFEVTPSNNRLEAEELPKIAEHVGLDVDKFNECLNSGRHAARVQEQLDDAVASGGRGTPYSVVINKDGEKYVINGSQPIETVRQIIEAALQ